MILLMFTSLIKPFASIIALSYSSAYHMVHIFQQLLLHIILLNPIYIIAAYVDQRRECTTEPTYDTFQGTMGKILKILTYYMK